MGWFLQIAAVQVRIFFGITYLYLKGIKPWNLNLCIQPNKLGSIQNIFEMNNERNKELLPLFFWKQSFPFETRPEGVNWGLRTWCEKARATKGGWRVAFEVAKVQNARGRLEITRWPSPPLYNNECCAWGKNRCFRNCVIIADAAVSSQKKTSYAKQQSCFLRR